MLRDTVLQHRAEKERLLSRSMVQREGVEAARKYLDTSLAKVIVGPRRAGKSTFALQLLAGRAFAYLNFDDEKLVGVKDYDDIVAALLDVYPGAEYFFLDEVHNLVGWELFVNKLLRRGHNLVLTGSNARLLAGELASSLTGRYVEIELLPFSFREFLTARSVMPTHDELVLPEVRGRISQHLDAYLQDGGFPEVVVNNLPPREYLSTLVDAVLFRDVVKRHRVRDPGRLHALYLHLASSFASEFTFSRLARLLGFRSVTTVETYAGHLEQAYLVSSLGRYSHKVGQLSRPPRKRYVLDTGLIGATTFQVSPAAGRLMENCVFAELLRRGYRCGKTLFCYRTSKGKEVDFVLRRGTKIVSAVQVCMDLAPTMDRELPALGAAARELDCNDLAVITWDSRGEETVAGRRIRVVPLYEWLLGP